MSSVDTQTPGWSVSPQRQELMPQAQGVCAAGFKSTAKALTASFMGLSPLFPLSLCSVWEWFALEMLAGAQNPWPRAATLRSRFPWAWRQLGHKWPGFSFPAGLGGPFHHCRADGGVARHAPLPKESPGPNNQMSLFCCCFLTMGLFQLHRNMHAHNKNRKEIYTNKNDYIIGLVLEGIQKIFLSIVAFVKIKKQLSTM